MTAKMTRAAELRASSFDESDNSVEVIFTAGAAVRRHDWRTDRFYSEVLEVTPKAVRLDRLNAGASFLNSHDGSDLKSVIGSVVPGSARVENGKGFARVRLSNAPGDADIVSKIRDGIVRNVSVGYMSHKVERTQSDDGQDDVWRVIDWEPFEISAVPIPADHGAQVRGQSEEAGNIEFVDAPPGIGDLDAETAKVLSVAAAAASVRSEGETALELAEFAYDAQFFASRSTQAAGIAFGAALVLASGADELRRALAARQANDDEQELEPETRSWPFLSNRPRF
ncbi:MAG TPA: HK97 family phage prohead protease [Pseudorhizobium sp.]|jgi:HK97 family phage prohead protease|nr:HK97 family phage prohead protease [Pseudorhizobium sp.]